MKACERCGNEIPEDFQNPLCLDCYTIIERENELKAKEEADIIKQEELAAEIVANYPNGVSDPAYQENPEAEDKPQWLANLAMFERSGVLLWKPTRQMYTFIRDYCYAKVTKHPQYPKFIWKPTIVDVGCGIGAGSNVLSEEADFVWGIDKNEKSVAFAKEAFTRNKGREYYSAQVSFDCIDIMNLNRDTMKFDLVTLIEVVEHVADHKKLLRTLIEKFDNRRPEEPTEYFISTPNRNNDSISKDRPRNKFHVREWKSEEFYAVLKEFFENVELMNAVGVPVPTTTNHTPLLARCSKPKI